MTALMLFMVTYKLDILEMTTKKREKFNFNEENIEYWKLFLSIKFIATICCMQYTFEIMNYDGDHQKFFIDFLILGIIYYNCEFTFSPATKISRRGNMVYMLRLVDLLPFGLTILFLTALYNDQFFHKIIDLVAIATYGLWKNHVRDYFRSEHLLFEFR